MPADSPKHNIYYPDARITLGVVLETLGDDNTPFGFPVRPERITIFRNSYIEADTFSVEFNATLLPLTPDMIRGAQAIIHVFNKLSLAEQPESVTKGEDFELQIGGREIQPSITGLVDEASMVYEEDGRKVILNGRDMTCLYLDADWDARFRMTYKERLDKVIQRLADDVPGSAGIMRVKVEPEGDIADLPVVGRGETRANRKGLVFPNKANFWEVMTSVAVRYGHIIFVKGNHIILTKPQTYIKGKTGHLAMAWGRNILDIHMARKLGKERVPTIECISYDERTGVPIVGSFPNEKATKAEARKKKQADKAKRRMVDRKIGKPEPKKSKGKRKKGQNATGLGTVRNEVKQYVFHGIRSKEQLEKIAEQAHAQFGRSEMTVQISTNELQDLDSQPLLDISSGDAIQVKFEPFNRDLVTETLKQELVRRGYDDKKAEEIHAVTRARNELKDPMRVDSATIDFDVSEGIAITVEMRQYVNLDVAEEEA